MSEAKARVSMTDGVLLEFEGSEAFVSGQLERFSRMITGDAASAPAAAVGVAPAATESAAASAPPRDSFNDIFAATGNGLQVLAKVPGRSGAQKMVNAAKLYLYGLHVTQQRDTAWFHEIGGVCRAHRCYDPNNMAATLKSAQDAFIFGGSGKKQTVKLSPNGLKGASQLVERLRSQ